MAVVADGASTEAAIGEAAGIAAAAHMAAPVQAVAITVERARAAEAITEVADLVEDVPAAVAIMAAEAITVAAIMEKPGMEPVAGTAAAITGVVVGIGRSAPIGASGGAIAAGAALGYVGAAAAASWARFAPRRRLLLVLYRPSRTQGFWDVCP